LLWRRGGGLKPQPFREPSFLRGISRHRYPFTILRSPFQNFTDEAAAGKGRHQPLFEASSMDLASRLYRGPLERPCSDGLACFWGDPRGGDTSSNCRCWAMQTGLRPNCTGTSGNATGLSGKKSQHAQAKSTSQRRIAFIRAGLFFCDGSIAGRELSRPEFS